MKDVDLEFIFWQELETCILGKMPYLIPILNSPDRFNLEMINDKSKSREYGLEFNKLKIFFTKEDEVHYLKVILDPSIVKENNGISVIEGKMMVRALKFKSKKDAEFKAQINSEWVLMFV